MSTRKKIFFLTSALCTVVLLFAAASFICPTAFAKMTYYFVRQDAPDNQGVPNGNPKNPDDCWKTISQAFADLKSDVGGTLRGKGGFIIQIQDTATYTESVTLDELTTTSADTLTLRKDPSLSGRPTIDATRKSGEAIRITTVAYVTIEGFTLKAAQNIGPGQYRVLHAEQTGLDVGLLTVRDNAFDGQGAGNDPLGQCALLQIMPMRIDCVIEGNEFFNFYDDDDSCPLLTVYTDTSGGEPVSPPEVIISDNVFHDNRTNVVIYNSDDYEHTGIIERNIIYNNRCPSSSGLTWGGVITFHIQDGPMVVRNNLIYNNNWSYLPGRAAIYCMSSDNKKIYNNTLYRNNASGGEIYVDANSNVGIEVKNNIICPNPNGKYCIYLEPGAEKNFVSANNCFYADFNNDNDYKAANDVVGYWTGADNTTSEWNSNPQNRGNIYNNPRLTNDMHINYSRCVNGGVDLGSEVPDDIDGDPRTIAGGGDGKYDIGADEAIRYPVEPRGKRPVTLGILKRTALYQNYPNPFNPETWIPYQLAFPANVTIRIYAQSGRLVRMLCLGYKDAGIYLDKSRAGYWDGRNEAGEPVASGVYFYQLSAGSFSQTRRMAVVK